MSIIIIAIGICLGSDWRVYYLSFARPFKKSNENKLIIKNEYNWRRYSIWWNHVEETILAYLYFIG